MLYRTIAARAIGPTALAARPAALNGRPLLAKLAEDLVGLGKAPFLLLREDHRVVAQDVVLAVLARLGGGLVVGGGVDLGCETRSPVVVAASDGAVENANRAHRGSIVLEDCTAEPIGAGLQRSNHDASLLLIQMMLGWVTSSRVVIDAVARHAEHSVMLR
jgi:hypothetical protein